MENIISLNATVYQNMKGSVKGETGTQTEMANWVVVFVERDTGICKVSEVDRIGNYEIKGLAINRVQTLILLNPDYKLESVYAKIVGNASQVLQYFVLGGDRIPALIQAGSRVEFTQSSAVAYDSRLTPSAGNDGIPNGMRPDILRMNSNNQKGVNKSLSLAGADDDANGIPYDFDPDIDNDGIVNWFDSDVDGNTTIDPFDPDSNGDDVLDTLESNTTAYFREGVEFFVTQVINETQTDGTTKTSLVFSTKVRGDAIFDEVKIRGAANLFDGSAMSIINASTGQKSLQAWNRTLADDGLNGDESAGDGIFSRTVELGSEKSPSPNQLVFLQIQKTVAENTISWEYPYMFPAMIPGSVTGTWDEASRTITIGGDLFKSYLDSTPIDNFYWSMHVFNSDGIKVFSSDSIPGTETTYVLPANARSKGGTYTAYIIAKSLAKVPGYSTWILKSASIDLK
ncbi:MAG: hypothetical protein HQK54_02010 [Oligoflexales bacterium]|nr:hypothetical protein [Oligoflexales bacterium]